jgi:hypothetical protein
MRRWGALKVTRINAMDNTQESGEQMAVNNKSIVAARMLAHHLAVG